MFDLAKCQNRIKFAEFFGKWLQQKLASMEEENHPIFSIYDDDRIYTIQQVIDNGFQLIKREIDNWQVRTIFAVPDNKGNLRESYWLWFYTNDTKKSICSAILDRVGIIGWELCNFLINEFLDEMESFPGYLKSFNDIERDCY